MTDYIKIEHKEKMERIPLAAQSDVLVIGGGSAGVTAAVSAVRNGCSVTLVERYGHLGGMASGGMVLVLDDMVNGQEITTTGIVDEFVQLMGAQGMAVFPPENERNRSLQARKKWDRWGCSDFRDTGDIKPIIYAVAFDPDAWKRTSLNLVRENKINLRLHSWFCNTIVEDNMVKGVICQTKEGKQALLGSIVIDCSGDLDVAAAAGIAAAIALNHRAVDSRWTTLLCRPRRTAYCREIPCMAQGEAAGIAAAIATAPCARSITGKYRCK